jgi:ferritin-like metal-binding protein YciE
MTVTNFNELYLNELRDIYSAERQLINALPRFAHAVTSDALRTSLNRQLEQTNGQISRLEEMFQDMSAPAVGHQCKAMSGLLTEADEAIRDVVPGLLLDSTIIACLQKLEHYKIAGYGTLRVMGGLIQKPEHVSLFTASMAEEKAADSHLGSMAALFLHDAAAAEIREDVAVPHGPDGMPFDRLGRDDAQMARDRGVGQGLGLAEGRGQENDPNRVLVPDPEDRV